MYVQAMYIHLNSWTNNLRVLCFNSLSSIYLIFKFDRTEEEALHCLFFILSVWLDYNTVT